MGTSSADKISLADSAKISVRSESRREAELKMQRSHGGVFKRALDLTKEAIARDDCTAS